MISDYAWNKSYADKKVAGNTMSATFKKGSKREAFTTWKKIKKVPFYENYLCETFPNGILTTWHSEGESAIVKHNNTMYELMEFKPKSHWR